MIKEKVEGIIKKAFERFSKNAGVTCKEISIGILPDSDLSPRYFKIVKNSFEKDENGNKIELNFNKDILDKKFDLLGTEHLVGFSLKGSIKTYIDEYKIDKNRLMLRIYTHDEDAKSLNIAIYNGNESVKTMTSSEFFGD